MFRTIKMWKKGWHFAGWLFFSIGNFLAEYFDLYGKPFRISNLRFLFSWYRWPNFCWILLLNMFFSIQNLRSVVDERNSIDLFLFRTTLSFMFVYIIHSNALYPKGTYAHRQKSIYTHKHRRSHINHLANVWLWIMFINF